MVILTLGDIFLGLITKDIMKIRGGQSCYKKKLGGGFEIIEEGLNSRTLFSDDNRVGKEGRNGWTYLKPCLDSHDKIDCIILMLGTNELKNSFNNSPEDVLNMIKKYIEFIKSTKSQIDKSTPQIIISGLPQIQENTEYCGKEDKYKGAAKKSKELNELYKEYCKLEGIEYIDNNDLQTGIDGVHLTEDAHAALANKLYDAITQIYN